MSAWFLDSELSICYCTIRPAQGSHLSPLKLEA